MLASATGVFAAPDRRPNILFAIADDWSWPFASIAGDKTCSTPAFDRVAREGFLFRNSFVNAPSCTPSRASILTGQHFWRLEQGANLFGELPAKFAVYPDALEKAGYHIGFTGKGWGPGRYEPGGRTRNPAGPAYNEHRAEPPARGISPIDYATNFDEFLSRRKPGQPFSFWYGANEPHRSYEPGSGLKAGKKLEDARVPKCLPDTPEVRSDLLDYAYEIEWADHHLSRMLQILERSGELDNTIIAVTGDNGLPFPRCKSNLYDTGTHVPLAIRWGQRVKAGRVVDDFVCLPDLAPTFLEAAGLKPLTGMTARSVMPVLLSSKPGQVDRKRDRVFVGKERHVEAQPDGHSGYPMRAVRTKDFLYIRNFKPERYPAGTEDTPYYSPFGDIDHSPTKSFLLEHRNDPAIRPFFELATARRPAEELYDLRKDPDQLKNVASDKQYANAKKQVAESLQSELRATGDPRVFGKGDQFDEYEPSTPPRKKN